VQAVKLCDRLHNTRSLPASNPTEEDVADYASETRRTLLPLAKGTRHAGLAKAARLLKAELAK
jgi:(p)ppGpp synthase/HD superfamily hydrolase